MPSESEEKFVRYLFLFYVKYLRAILQPVQRMIYIVILNIGKHTYENECLNATTIDWKLCFRKIGWSILSDVREQLTKEQM